MIKINETKNGVTLFNNNIILIENVILARSNELATPKVNKFGIAEYKAEFVINKSLEMGKINALLEIVNEYEKNQGMEELSKSEYTEEKNFNSLCCNSWYTRMNFVIKTSSRAIKEKRKHETTGVETEVQVNPIKFLDKGKNRITADGFGVNSVCHISIKMFGNKKLGLGLDGIMHTGTIQTIERPYDDSHFDYLVDLGTDNKKSKNILSPF